MQFYRHQQMSSTCFLIISDNIFILWKFNSILITKFQFQITTIIIIIEKNYYWIICIHLILISFLVTHNIYDLWDFIYKFLDFYWFICWSLSLIAKIYFIFDFQDNLSAHIYYYCGFAMNMYFIYYYYIVKNSFFSFFFSFFCVY